MEATLDNRAALLSEQGRAIKRSNKVEAIVHYHLSDDAKQRIAQAYRDAAKEKKIIGDFLTTKADDASTGELFDFYILESQEQYQHRGLLLKKASTIFPDDDPVETNVSTREFVVPGASGVAAYPSNDAVADSSTQPLHFGDQPAGMQTSTPEPPAAWMPVAVRYLPPVKVTADLTNLDTFPWETMVLNIGGREWSPGFYYTVKPSCEKALKGCQSFWLLEGPLEPFAPSSPGKHGAKITAIFRPSTGEEDEPEESAWNNIPVFIASKHEGEYTYMGHYRQVRYSDKIDFDTLQQIPEHVLQYWAAELTKADRPRYVTDQLINHFFPRPQYEGPITGDSAVSIRVNFPSDSADQRLEPSVVQALNQYGIELKEWHRSAQTAVSELTPQHIMNAFRSADSAAVPALRLNWEYLQCVGYDQEFYQRMVYFKYSINPEGRIRSGPNKESRHEPRDPHTILREDMELIAKHRKINVDARAPSPGRSTPKMPQSLASSRHAPTSSSYKTQQSSSGHVPPHMRR